MPTCCIARTEMSPLQPSHKSFSSSNSKSLILTSSDDITNSSSTASTASSSCSDQSGRWDIQRLIDEIYEVMLKLKLAIIASYKSHQQSLQNTKMFTYINQHSYHLQRFSSLMSQSLASLSLPNINKKLNEILGRFQTIALTASSTITSSMSVKSVRSKLISLTEDLLLRAETLCDYMMPPVNEGEAVVRQGKGKGLMYRLENLSKAVYFRASLYGCLYGLVLRTKCLNLKGQAVDVFERMIIDLSNRWQNFKVSVDEIVMMCKSVFSDLSNRKDCSVGQLKLLFAKVLEFVKSYVSIFQQSVVFRYPMELVAYYCSAAQMMSVSIKNRLISEMDKLDISSAIAVLKARLYYCYELLLEGFSQLPQKCNPTYLRVCFSDAALASRRRIVTLRENISRISADSYNHISTSPMIANIYFPDFSSFVEMVKGVHFKESFGSIKSMTFVGFNRSKQLVLKDLSLGTEAFKGLVVTRLQFLVTFAKDGWETTRLVTIPFWPSVPKVSLPSFCLTSLTSTSPVDNFSALTSDIKLGSYAIKDSCLNRVEGCVDVVAKACRSLSNYWMPAPLNEYCNSLTGYVEAKLVRRQQSIASTSASLNRSRLSGPSTLTSDRVDALSTSSTATSTTGNVTPSNSEEAHSNGLTSDV